MSKDPFAALDTLTAAEPTTAIPDVLAHRPSTANRNRDWEKSRRRNGTVATYRGIPKDLKQAVKSAAEDHHVPVGEVARAFLEYALAAYQAGDLELHAEFGPGKLTLFPS